MATNTYTPATSFFTDKAGDHAFDLDSAGADTLTIDQDAYVIALGTGAAGALLAATGAWTVNVNGGLFSDQAEGLILAAGNAAISKITVGVNGGVEGDTKGISAQSAVTIVNAGSIYSDLIAISLETSTNSITNTGIIRGAFGQTAISSNGLLSNDTLTNNGSVLGKIDLGGGNDKITNSKLIDGNISLGDGNDVVSNLVNAGIVGIIALGEGKNSITSAGSISGSIVSGILTAITSGDGDDTISVASVAGAITLGNGKNSLTASSKVIGSVTVGTGDDTVTLKAGSTGAIGLGDGTNKLTVTGDTLGVSSGNGADTIAYVGSIDGNVMLGNGANALTVTSVSGDIIGGADVDKIVVKAGAGVFGTSGTINLGEGNNSLYVAFHANNVTAGSGNDVVTLTAAHIVNLGDGDNVVNANGIMDFLTLGDGNDKVTVGGGIDQLQLGSGTNTVNTYAKGFATYINLLIDDGFLGKHSIVNAGSILGVDFDGVLVSLNNTGYVGQLLAENLASIVAIGSTVMNTGVMGETRLSSIYNDTVTNSGTIHSLALGSGNNTLTNSGTVTTFVNGGNGVDKVTNTGVIGGNVSLGDNTNTFVNSKTVSGNVSVGDDIDVLTNNANATIGGSVSAGAGNDKFSNAGVVQGNVSMGDNDDTLTNTGSILGGVSLGAGVDSFSNSKHVQGIVSGSGITSIVNTATATIDGTIYLSAGKLDNAGKINGDIDSEYSIAIINKGVIDGLVSFGLDLSSDPNSVTNSGTIGSIESESAFAVVSNSKTIEGHVWLTAGSKFTNTGYVGGDFKFMAPEFYEDRVGVLINSGTIVGEVLLLGKVNDEVQNSGVIGSVSSFQYDSTITNSKTIGTLTLRGGADTLTNSGTVGDVDFGIGANKLVNSGVTGKIITGADADTITNSGNLHSITDTGGDNVITNTGIMGVVSLGAGQDTFTNFVTTKNGLVGGNINLGAGDDKFFGGSLGERVVDAAGSDSYQLGGGNDLYLAKTSGSDGNDIVDGGIGIDSYDASEATNTVVINLDNITHDRSPYNPTQGEAAANQAYGIDISGSASKSGTKDTILNFENAYGGSGDDAIYGNSSNNALYGNDGVDNLFGQAGNDELFGGSGNDVLHGGAGKDRLSGGLGVDQFCFTSETETGTTAATRDEIIDFQDGSDLIHLIYVDPNKTNAITDPLAEQFVYIGSNVQFTGVAGQLRSYWTPTGHLIEGDTNGDGKADFSIAITSDPFHSVTLTAADFVL